MVVTDGIVIAGSRRSVSNALEDNLNGAFLLHGLCLHVDSQVSWCCLVLLCIAATVFALFPQINWTTLLLVNL